MSTENNKPTIKGSKENIKLAPTLTVFAVAAVAGMVIRYIQMLKFIDPKTGFTTGGNALSIILYALIVVSSLFICVTSFLSADSKKIAIGNSGNKLASIGTRLFAISLLGYTYYCLYQVMFNSGTASAYTDVMKNGAVPMTLQSIFAFISAIYLFILASDFSKGTAKAYNRKFLATAPVFWAGARLIYRFLRQISFVEVSDLLLELVMIAFMIMFFMALAQVSSGVYKDSFKWRIPGLGLSAAIIAATVSVPRMIVAITARELVNKTYPFSLTDLLFVIFIITLMVKIKEDAKMSLPASAEDKAE